MVTAVPAGKNFNRFKYRGEALGGHNMCTAGFTVLMISFVITVLMQLFVIYDLNPL
jgi:hypothetical protein